MIHKDLSLIPSYDDDKILTNWLTFMLHVQYNGDDAEDDDQSCR